MKEYQYVGRNIVVSGRADCRIVDCDPLPMNERKGAKWYLTYWNEDRGRCATTDYSDLWRFA
jgi:hypothetical protein